MVSKMLKVSVVVLVVATMCSFASFTEAREFGEIYRDCGLGAMIFPTTPVGAVVSNILWDWGTTAIISNASSPDTCAGKSATTAAFIHDAYDSIVKDLARGNGEYVNTLMALAGCNAQVSQPFALSLRSELATLVAAPNYSSQTQYQKAENLYNLFYKQLEGQFAGFCAQRDS